VLIPRSGILGAVEGLLVGRTVTSAVQWVAFFRLSKPEASGGTS
jgi:hypothetical protein